MKLAVNIPTKLTPSVLYSENGGWRFGGYSDWTIDVLDVRFLNDDFFCFETELPYL
jgi:hypothetical protein